MPTKYLKGLTGINPMELKGGVEIAVTALEE